MNAPDMDASTRFLQTLEIVPPSLRVDGPVAEASSINANMITLFEGPDAVETAQDVLDTQLFAWLGATAKFDMYKDRKSWWAFYREILARIGWTVQEYSFSAYVSSRQQFTIADWMGDVLGQQAPDDEAPVMRALERLRNLAGSLPVAALNAYSHDRHNGALQALVSRVAGGDPTVDALACMFTTTADVPIELLPFSFSTDATTCSNAFETITLNEQVYGPLRKVIQEKLACNPLRYTQQFVES